MQFLSLAAHYTVKVSAHRNLCCYNPGMTARTVLGVVAGDVISIGSTLLLFYLAHVDPHAPASIRFMVFSIVYGISFALLAGFIAGLISRRPDVLTGMLLALIIAVPAAITFVRSGQEAMWTQAAAFFLMAPAALMGDWLRKNRRSA